MIKQHPALENVLQIDEWHTPCTDYPRLKQGNAQISQTRYPRSMYLFENMEFEGKKYASYEVLKPLTITTLKIGGKIWMVDDPTHWFGTKYYLDTLNPSGHLLIAGLGLGIVLHHLYKNYPNVKQITVIEINQNVIDLICPLLPKDDRVTFVCADFYSFCVKSNLTEKSFDYLYWDLAVGNGKDQRVKDTFTMGRTFATLLTGNATFFGAKKNNEPFLWRK